jgi:hypothetical protein
MSNSEFWLVVATGLLALGTWALVWFTWRAARKDLRGRSQLQFVDRYNNQRMIEWRKTLASALLNKVPHEQIKDYTLMFFDELGLFHRHGYLEKSLIWSTFGFDAICCWKKSYDYIQWYRNRWNDQGAFSDFEKLFEIFRKMSSKKHLPEPTDQLLDEFLRDESNL